MKTIKLSNRSDIQTFLPDFYNQIAYDGSPEFSEYVPTGVWFTLLEDDVFAGFINLLQLNNVTWICHVMIYPAFRKNGSENWAIKVADYMRNNHGVKNFLAITPYESAKRYAERAGFTLIGKLSGSIQKNNELLDQYILERN